VFLQEICQPASAVCEFDVRPSQRLAIRGYVHNGFGVGLNLSGALEEECWGELVDVVVVCIG
jgi:hypothetical protein